VPSTTRDGVLGIFMYNLVSFKRRLIAVVRKSSLCRCGCKGWCTLHPIWCFVHWSLQSMGRGLFPTGRHDGAPWKPADAERASLGGSQLSFVGMLLQIKGDWLEFCSSLGLANWSGLQCPCPFCRTTKATMGTFQGFSPVSSVFPKVTTAEYEAACTACEIKKVLSREEYIAVKNNLAYNKTRDGPRGRALVANLPALGLMRDDRIEPDKNLQEIGNCFDRLATAPAAFPVALTFWRRANEVPPSATVLRRRARHFLGHSLRGCAACSVARSK